MYIESANSKRFKLTGYELIKKAREQILNCKWNLLIGVFIPNIPVESIFFIAKHTNWIFNEIWYYCFRTCSGTCCCCVGLHYRTTLSDHTIGPHYRTTVSSVFVKNPQRLYSKIYVCDEQIVSEYKFLLGWKYSHHMTDRLK